MAYLLLALLAQTAAPPGSDHRTWEDPPTEMIDFLGRRQRCAGLGEPGERTASDRIAAERWRCAALPEEERAWRARSADNALARAWLDLDPLQFRLNSVRISAWDGPPAALPRRVEQNGVDLRTGQPYRLVIESDAAGRLTRITASFADVPARSFTLDQGQLPWLDLQSLRVMLGTPPARRPQLHVMLNYGEGRDYCFMDGGEDRPEVQIVFGADGVRGYRTDGENCRMSGTDLPDAAAR